jgi:glutamine amidotransferase
VSRTVGVVDYGLGNLRSVAGAVERLDWTATVTSDAEELARCDKLILPGVGAFGDGMRNLRERGLVEPLTSLAMERGKPVLGVCLGAQLLVSESEEFGRHEGLGWIGGSVRRLSSAGGLRVPHVGWNELHQTGTSVLFDGVLDGALFYYVHSFVIEPADRAVVKGETDYGRALTAVVERDNVYGTQFHPEKSQLDGLTLLRNFLERA